MERSVSYEQPGSLRAATLLALCALLLTATPAAAAQAHSAISGQHVLQLTQGLLAAAPKRFNGSPGHAAAEILRRLLRLAVLNLV